MLKAVSQGRVMELDATRGVAMLAVCLSHAVELLQDHQNSSLGSRLIAIGLLATPTFLLLSGMVCGYLADLQPHKLTQLRWRWFDRALCLLLVSHLLLGITHAAWSPWRNSLLASFYMTDAAALGLLGAAAGLVKLRKRVLVVLGFATVVLSAIAAHGVTTQGVMQQRLLLLLVGQVYEAADVGNGYVVPVLPYLGIFMIGIAGGRHYVQLQQSGHSKSAIAISCLKLGGSCMAVAVLLKLIWMGYHADEAVPDLLLHDMVALRQKLPPGLGYALLYGGAGMVVAGLLGLASELRSGQRAVHLFATIGRASLVVFLLQYWLFFFPERTLHVGALSGVPFIAYVMLVLVLLWWVAAIWGRVGGNRYLTLGLWKLAKKRAFTASSPASA